MEHDQKPPVSLLCNRVALHAGSQPTGISVLKLCGEYVLVRWFHEEVEVTFLTSVLSSPCGLRIPERNQLFQGIPLAAVLEKDGGGYFLDRSGCLLCVNQQKNTLNLSHCITIRAGFRHAHAIQPDGLLILSVISGSWHVITYHNVDSGLQLDSCTQLASVPVEYSSTLKWPNTDCVVTSCKGNKIDSALAKFLVPNRLLMSDEDIIIIGFSSGQVFHVSAIGERSLLLYASVEPIVGVMMYKDPSVEKYSAILMIQESGAVVVISTVEQSAVHYKIMYLPSRVRCSSKLDGNLFWISDGAAVWQIKMVASNYGLVIEANCVGKERVIYLGSIEGRHQVIAHTSEGNVLLYSKLETATRNTANFNLMDTHTIQSKIVEKNEQLFKIKQAILKEDSEISTINFSKRAPLMKDKFLLSIKVLDGSSSPDSIVIGRRADATGRYVLQVSIKNNSLHEIPQSSWSLHITVIVGKVTTLKTIALNSPFGKDPLEFQVSVWIRNPCHTIQIECNLVSRVSVPVVNKAEDSCYNWLLIPIGSANLDVSYFFKPCLAMPYKQDPCKVAGLSGMLRKIAEQNGVGDLATELMGKERSSWLNTQVECEYVLKLPQEMNYMMVWTKVVKNCLHRCSRDLLTRLRPRKHNNPNQMDCETEPIQRIYIVLGSGIVTLSLDTECTQLVIRSCEARLLHSVKDTLMTLLHSTTNTEDLTVLFGSLWKQAMEFKSLLASRNSMESKQTSDVNQLKNTWRKITSSLPY